MPHQILGFGWDELASIIGVFSVVFGGFIGWLVHTVNDNFAKNSKPLNENIEKLSDVINMLKYQLQDHQKNIDNVSKQVDKINDKVTDHEARLKILEQEENAKNE
nr:hypothetical protein [uncultured Ligilactobacillus sp.]